MDNKDLASHIFFLMLLAVISAYSGFLWNGQTAQYVFLISALCLFGLLSQIMHKFLDLTQLRIFLSIINIFVIVILAYYSFFSVYFSAPLIIILLSFIFYKKDRFFAMNFWTNFISSMGFLYVIVEFVKPTLLDIYVYLIIVFNSLLSLASILVKSYKEIETPMKTSASYYNLKSPRYYVAIMMLIPFVLILGGILALDETLLSLLAVIMGLLLLILFSYAFNDIIIDKNSLIIKKALLHKQTIIKLKDVQKAVINQAIGMHYIPTNILEIYLKKGVKRIDIRTNYNSKDTAKFLSALKNVLGKRFVK